MVSAIASAMGFDSFIFIYFQPSSLLVLSSSVSIRSWLTSHSTLHTSNLLDDFGFKVVLISMHITRMMILPEVVMVVMVILFPLSFPLPFPFTFTFSFSFPFSIVTITPSTPLYSPVPPTQTSHSQHLPITFLLPSTYVPRPFFDAACYSFLKVSHSILLSPLVLRLFFILRLSRSASVSIYVLLFSFSMFNFPAGLDFFFLYLLWFF